MGSTCRNLALTLPDEVDEQVKELASLHHLTFAEVIEHMVLENFRNETGEPEAFIVIELPRDGSKYYTARRFFPGPYSRVISAIEESYERSLEVALARA